MTTPEPERLSEEDVVLSVVIVVVPVAPELFTESSLLPQEKMFEAKPAINKVYKILFINSLKKIITRSKLKINLKNNYNLDTFSHPGSIYSLPHFIREY